MNARNPIGGDDDPPDQPRPPRRVSSGVRPLAATSWKQFLQTLKTTRSDLAPLFQTVVDLAHKLPDDDDVDDMLDNIARDINGRSYEKTLDALHRAVRELEAALVEINPPPQRIATSGSPIPSAVTARCWHHCHVYVAILTATVPPNEHDAFRVHSLQCVGQYDLWLTVRAGQPAHHKVTLSACPHCRSPRFKITKFPPSNVAIPNNTNAGTFFRFGNKLNIQMFEKYRQESIIRNVPQNPRATRNPYVAILLDSTGTADSIDANKALMVRRNTPASMSLTESRIASFLADRQTETPGVLRAIDNLRD